MIAFKKIKKELSNILTTLKMVFLNKKYFLLVIFIVFLIVFVPNFLINYKLLTGGFCASLTIEQKLIIVFGLLEGSIMNNTLITLILQSIIGLLTGISLSLMHFKYTLNKKIVNKEGIFSSFGAILGLLFGGCASCSLALISLFGAGALFAFLPFGGIEIMILAIILLLISILSAANSIQGLCKING